MLVAGIDGGSRAIKVVVLDADTREVLASGERDQGVDHNGLAAGLLDGLLAARGASRREVGRIVATGYTRSGILAAHTTVAEITCHACGVRRPRPDARTVVEIGGQDSKLLRLNADGSVRDFAMNDRCAAGTGRFLEMVAGRVDADLAGLGALARAARQRAAISSMCVVFAETEIIGLLASGVEPANIVAGVQAAIATRVAAVPGRAVTAPVVFTGGVARVPGMAEALSEALGAPVETAPQPQFTGALGAALLAATQLRNGGAP
jgi:predicted CoA-substrate-specific enzyme activase